MSNKTLVLTIILIILAGSAAAAYYYWQQTKPLKIAPEPVASDQFAQQSSQPTPTAQGTNNSTPTPTTNPTPTAQSGTCTRDFSSTKLSNNGNISTANRQAEITVAGYGKITVEFYDKDAPKTVQNFLRLTDSGYYDCLTFHRIAKGFVIQGGDPNGTGSGGQSAFGSAFADELNPNTPSYKAGYAKGVLAMANSGPNTNGSQFFIMLADNQLQHAYTIFGKVISGLDVVDKIGQVPINPVMGPNDGSPVKPVVMTSVKIVK